METKTIDTGEKPNRRVAILLGLVVILVVVVWLNARPSASSDLDAPDASRPETIVDGSRVEQRPPTEPAEATPSLDIVALLQPTPSPTLDPAAERTLITETVSIIPLPTVTPSPTPAPLSPLVVEIDGRATISMTLSGAIVQSSGRPLRMTIPRRTYRFDETHVRHLDRWCIPMGVVHTVVEVDMVANPATESVLATGTISLYTDYCDNPGPLADQSTFEFEVGLEQTVPLVQYLESKRELLAVPRLLDTEAEASVTLNFASSRPAD
jgi:hypothetical protein